MPGPARPQIRSRWVGLTAFVLFMVVACVLLGRWQLGRAHVQNQTDRAQATALAAAPVALNTLLAVGEPLTPGAEWRAVTVSGRYDADHQVLVRNRSFNSRNGYLVMVPLRTAAGDLLVVRGWVPSGSTAESPDTVPDVPVGVVTVTGRLRQPEPGAPQTGMPPGQASRIVPEQIAAATGRPTYDAWLSLESETPPPDQSAQIQLLRPDGSSGWSWPISHTVYAVQWFIFGVIAVVGWFVLLRRDVREPAEAAPGTQRPEGPE